MQEVLQRRTHRSTLILRKLLGTIRLEPIEAESRRPYYQAVSSLNVLPLLEKEPGENGSTEGSNNLHWWRRRESNPRPKIFSARCLHAYFEYLCLVRKDPLGNRFPPDQPACCFASSSNRYGSSAILLTVASSAPAGKRQRDASLTRLERTRSYWRVFILPAV